MLLAVYREPFSLAPPRAMRLPEGETLAQLRARMPGLPPGFDAHGVICIDGHAVPRALWGAVRPKAAVTEITFHAPARGGGNGKKNPLATIAAIALTVVTGNIAAGKLLGGVSGAIAGATGVSASVAAFALAGTVSLMGSLLLSSLIKPPTWGDSADPRRQDRGAASAGGNVLEPNAAIPRVIGTRKVYPPMAMEPLTYFDGPDEVVEAAYVLAGPHKLEDLRIGPAPLASMTDVEIETREGWMGEPLVNLLSRQARTEALNAELRGHIVGDDNRTIESAAGDILTALPQRQIIATREAPDEHQIQIVLPQGLQLTDKSNGDGIAARVPLRIRARRVGDSEWRNLPELHFSGRQLGQIRATIRMVWTDAATVTPEVASGLGWVEVRRSSPGQTAAPASDPWQADPYFGTSGPDWMDVGNLGTTGVEHVQADRWTVSLFLDRAAWPPGRYEFELVRGAAFRASAYAAASYQYNGSVWDFFGYRGTPGEIAMSREQLIDTVYLARSVSIWNEHPLPSRDLAVIAVRARNRAVDRLSVLASGWVRDWDGSAWASWVTTSNPAPHLVDIWTGMQNVDPVPDALIWQDRLLAWRAHCDLMGYTVDAIVEDRTVDDAARLVASCGYAQPYMSDQWAVVYDRDTSAEAPVQVFTPRNSQDFSWSKGFARMPDGLRINFAERLRDYEPRQISVYRPGLSNDNGRVEQVDYPGIVDLAPVRRRALYDQAQAMLRSTFYSLSAPAEYLMCRRGDLVGLQHDALFEWAGSARITAAQLNGAGDTVAIRTDVPLDIQRRPYLDESPNLAAEPRLDLLGLEIGMAIRGAGSVQTYRVADDGGWIALDPPAPGDVTGALVVTGASGSIYLRVIVGDIEPAEDLTANLTLVDEAPQIWSMING